MPSIGSSRKLISIVRLPGRSRKEAGSRTISGLRRSSTISTSGWPTNSVSSRVGANTSVSNGKITSIFVQIFASTGSRHFPHTQRCGQTYQTTGILFQYIISANRRLNPG